MAEEKQEQRLFEAVVCGKDVIVNERHTFYVNAFDLHAAATKVLDEAKKNETWTDNEDQPVIESIKEISGQIIP